MNGPWNLLTWENRDFIHMLLPCRIHAMITDPYDLKMSKSDLCSLVQSGGGRVEALGKDRLVDDQVKSRRNSSGFCYLSPLLIG